MGSGGREIARVKRSKEEARAAYDRLSRWYDLFSEPSERAPRAAGLRLLAVQPGERVLEIGFGTGHALVALARAVGPEGQVHGVDISPGMREIAARRLSRAGLAPWVALHCGDAASLSFPDASVDAVFMSFSLELFDTPDIPAVLGVCARVLRPGGRIAVVSMSADGGPSAMRRWYLWAHERFPRLVDCRPIFAEGALREAGFQVVTRRMMRMWGLPVAAVVARR